MGENEGKNGLLEAIRLDEALRRLEEREKEQDIEAIEKSPKPLNGTDEMGESKNKKGLWEAEDLEGWAIIIGFLSICLGIASSYIFGWHAVGLAFDIFGLICLFFAGSESRNQREKALKWKMEWMEREIIELRDRLEKLEWED